MKKRRKQKRPKPSKTELPGVPVLPVPLPSAGCAVCREPLDPTSDRCLTCGADIGAPNVRAALLEAQALDQRYDHAVRGAELRGAKVVLDRFAKELQTSGIVVNCNLSFLKDFVTAPKTLYANYHALVQGGVRKAALPDHDFERSVVDAIMFRSYAPHIRFGALALNTTGVRSYGPYALRLRDVAVANRSSFLEENSFEFVRRHSLSSQNAGPVGYRSDWSGRGKLAIAKLGNALGPNSPSKDFAGLLVTSEGNFMTDKFVEVHIFGTFDFSAVEVVSGPAPKSGMDIGIWEVVKEAITKAGKRVEEIR